MITRIMLLLSISLFTSFSLAKTWIADPTRPPSYREQKADIFAQVPRSETEHPEWIINSIIISPAYKLVIINGKQLKIGDEIEGAKIIDISYQQVTLVYKKKKFVLSLRKSFISEINK